MDSGPDPSHVYLKPLFPMGQGQELHSICKRYLPVSYLDSPQAYSGGFPEVTSITKGLGMPDQFPGFWCQLALPGFCDFLFLFVVRIKGCGTPSFCQQFMVRIITAMQGIQEELQLLWTRKLKGVNPWLGVRVCVCWGAFWLQGLIWKCEVFYAWCV